MRSRLNPSSLTSTCATRAARFALDVESILKAVFMIISAELSLCCLRASILRINPTSNQTQMSRVDAKTISTPMIDNQSRRNRSHELFVSIPMGLDLPPRTVQLELPIPVRVGLKLEEPTIVRPSFDNARPESFLVGNNHGNIIAQANDHCYY